MTFNNLGGYTLALLIILIFVGYIIFAAWFVTTSFQNSPKRSKKDDEESSNPKATKDGEMALPDKVKVGKVMKLNCMGEGGIYFSTDRTREWVDPFEANRLNKLLHDLRSGDPEDGIFKSVLVVEPMEVLTIDDYKLLMNKRTTCGLSDSLVQFQLNSQLVEDIITIQIYSLMIDHDIPQYIDHAGNQLFIEDILEKDALINGEYRPLIVVVARNMKKSHSDDERIGHIQLSIGLPYCIDMTKTFDRYFYDQYPEVED